MKKKPEVYLRFLRNAKNSFLASARTLHNVAPKPTTRTGNKNHVRSPSPSQIALVLKVHPMSVSSGFFIGYRYMIHCARCEVPYMSQPHQEKAVFFLIKGCKANYMRVRQMQVMDMITPFSIY